MGTAAHRNPLKTSAVARMARRVEEIAPQCHFQEEPEDLLS
jgi:hypothetical protein